MKPANYVDPPDLGKMFPVLALPPRGNFWTEAGKMVAWFRYLWTGPQPAVQISLRTIYPDTQFSPQTIYESISEEVVRKQVPGVYCDRVILRESGPFSPYRTYLRIHREFNDYFVCAAPVGTSFFVSVRTVDLFPHVKWFHYLLVLGFLAMVYQGGRQWDGILGGVVATAVTISLVWSIFRYASCLPQSWLEERIVESPLAGPLFVRWFRPDTFFRQDIHAAFVSLVDAAIQKVVSGLDPAPPMRPDSQAQDGPIRRDLHSSE